MAHVFAVLRHSLVGLFFGRELGDGLARGPALAVHDDADVRAFGLGAEPVLKELRDIILTEEE